MDEPIIFRDPPTIPSGLSDVVTYKLKMKDYKLRTRTVTWISIQLLGTLLALGIIWITVDWVKAAVTILALLIVLILLISLTHVL